MPQHAANMFRTGIRFGVWGWRAPGTNNGKIEGCKIQQNALFWVLLYEQRE